MRHASLLLPLAVLLAAGCAQIPTSVNLHSDNQAGEADGTAANPDHRQPRFAIQPFVPRMPTPDPLLAIPHPFDSTETAQTTESEAAPAISLWERVRKGFVMAPLNSPHVQEWERWYSSRPEYVARMIERSSRYLHHIVEEVERRKMPAEIALLPMIESAYNPVAYSSAHASGIWQFIPSTGRHYGLQQNWWYDGRRDIIAATNAALDYLEKLYGMFGDWELALASYNWGEGAVGRAVARNKARGVPANYENLTMPAETRHYIPKLLAVKNIIADPARFGLQIADIPNQPYFGTVALSHHMDIQLAAKLADMPMDEFRFLNPAHNKLVIKADEAETIILPTDRIPVFLANLANHNNLNKPLVSWQAHVLKPGERLETVAARHGLTVARLKEINGITPANARNKVAAGRPLLVPAGSTAEPNLPNLPATPVTLPRAIQAAANKPGAKPNRNTARAARPAARTRPQRAAAKTQAKGKAAPTSRVAAQKKAKPEAKAPAARKKGDQTQVAVNP